MPLLFLLLGVGVVAVAAAGRKTTGGSVPGGLLYVPSPAAAADGNTVFKAVMARWAAYRDALGGRPPEGTADLTSALQAVADRANAIGVQKDKEAAAFRSAVNLLFTKETGDVFQKFWEAAKSLGGVEKHYDPALLDEAAECQRQSLLQGWPTVLYSNETLLRWEIYSAVRAAICFPMDQYPKLDARRAAAMKRLYAAIVLHSKVEPGTLVFRFSQGALIGDEYSDAWHQARMTVPDLPNETRMSDWMALCAVSAGLATKKSPAVIAQKLFPFVWSHIVKPVDTMDVPVMPGVAVDPVTNMLANENIAIVQAEIASAAFAIADNAAFSTPGLLPPAKSK